MIKQSCQKTLKLRKTWNLRNFEKTCKKWNFEQKSQKTWNFKQFLHVKQCNFDLTQKVFHTDKIYLSLSKF